MEIIESGVLWIVRDDPGGGSEGAFSGILDDSVRLLEQKYWQYCMSIKTQESFLIGRKVDLDLVTLDEGKSLSGWGGSPDRKSYGKKIKASPHYRKIIKQETGHASRKLQRRVRDFRAELHKLVSSYQGEKLSMKDLRNKSSDAFRKIYQEAWEAGRRASGLFKLQKANKPTKEEESWFRGAVREELSHWNNFLDEISRGKKMSFPVSQRVDMYADSVLFMFHIGRISGMPDNVLLHWYPKERKVGVMCPGCRFMVDNSPYPRDIMPTVPRAGDTPCLMRCVHKVVVRYVSPSEVSKRRDALGDKNNLRKRLIGRMKYRPKRKRGRGKAYDPWAGRKKKWGELR